LANNIRFKFFIKISFYFILFQFDYLDDINVNGTACEYQCESFEIQPKTNQEYFEDIDINAFPQLQEITLQTKSIPVKTGPIFQKGKDLPPNFIEIKV